MKSLSEINWEQLRSKSFTKSPKSWQDQVLYFIMIDRFSDGKETAENEYSNADFNSAIKTQEEAQKWRAAGDTYVGGTLKGVISKLDYLSKLGVTTLWLSPVLKQTSYDKTTYHGYGTQNFLETDPHFGTLEDMQELVRTAHEKNMFVILDIIINHAGNVFTYDLPPEQLLYGKPDFNIHGTYPVRGFYNEAGQAVLPLKADEIYKDEQSWPNGAVWPKELQGEDAFNRRGCIQKWEDEEQFLYGDFLFLKDFHLGKYVDGGLSGAGLIHGENSDAGLERTFKPSKVLRAMIEIYKYWIAATDLDGYRIDAVKHMPKAALMLFVSQIHDFAKQIGKDNFYCIGEVAGGLKRAHTTKQETSLDAILAIDDIPGSLERMIKGESSPQEFFRYFSDQARSSHEAWNGSELIVMYDDHDQIRNGYDKKRFAADEIGTKLAGTAICVLSTVSGIPCIYSGSEQALDGAGGDDNYIREAMFGGAFGAFRSKNKHVFREWHPAYKQATDVCNLRKEYPALRTGTQELLEISGDGINFDFPQKYEERMKSLVAWKRELGDEILICAFNTDVDSAQKMWVKVGGDQQTEWKYIYSSEQNLEQKMLGESCETNNLEAIVAVQISVPAAGFVIVKNLKTN